MLNNLLETYLNFFVFGYRETFCCITKFSVIHTGEAYF